MATDREVVDGVIIPEHSGPSPELREALDAWPGTHYWSRGEGPARVVLVRALRPAPKERWWLHLALLVLTFATVWFAYATLLIGPTPRIDLPAGLGVSAIWDSLRNLFEDSTPAIVFAAALMGILLAHEMGHYVVAKGYHINASPPYFLPAPYQLSFIGTFGAFIRLRSPIIDRRQLLDVGAAGPWAGLVVALAVLAIGILKSDLLPAGNPGLTHQLVYIRQAPFYIGESILMTVVRGLLVGDGTVILHPLALAGWFGIFITMLNLMPLGQLDGGHILYALIGRHQAKVGRLMWYALIVMAFQARFWPWLLWAVLILLVGRGRIAHPSVLEPHRPIPASRWPWGVATALIFLVTFTGNPFPSWF